MKMERRDVPVGSLEEDEFGIGRYVSALSEFIKSSDTPITIALQGEWGSGKSSFMRILENNLCRKELPEEERFDSIWINGWDLFLECDYEAAVQKLLVNLITQVEEHFEEKVNEQKAARRKQMLKGYVKAVSSVVLGAVNVDGETADALFDNVLDRDKDVSSLRKMRDSLDQFIAGEVETRGNGITDRAFLIFVDDLDRLEPKMAVTLLEALKNLFDIQKCVFILSIDYDVVACGIAQKYGNSVIKNRNIEKDFFDKLIQVPFAIPMSKYEITPMVMDRLRDMRFFDRDYNYIRYQTMIVDIVRLATNKNPRAIKRLLNMMQLAITMERAREEHPQPQLMIMKLLLLSIQLTFPDVYRMLVQNTNLETWKRSVYVGDRRSRLSDQEKKQYGLDEEWKEIIYLSVAGDEVTQRNYYRLARLLEIYEEILSRCRKAGDQVQEAFGVVNVICRQEIGAEVLYEGQDYDRSSQTQFKQGIRLINDTDFSDVERVLDVGCGTGKTTIDVWYKNQDMHITAFDLSESQITMAMENYVKFLEDQEKKAAEKGEPAEEFAGGIEFKVMDALNLRDKEAYDLVFSNATLHWISDAEKMYGLLYDALIPEGRLAVHQGGFGTYRGLHKAARKAAENLGMGKKLKNWVFPANYPKKEEMEAMLREIGFEDIRVDAVESDEKDNQNLVENFAKASLIFYKDAGFDDEEYKRLEEEYLRICQSDPKLDKYSNRLYIYAKKPKGKPKDEGNL